MSDRTRGRLRRLLGAVMAAAFLAAAALLAADAYDFVRAALDRSDTRSLYHGGAGLIAGAAAEERERIDPAAVLAEAARYVAEEAARAPAAEEETAAPDGGDAYPEETPPVQADFEELLATNPDTVGWLTCGAEIDYPVVQRDNEYYLSHNFRGRTDANGTLFLNPIGRVFPRDRILLIHGHASRGRAMFGSLRNFKDEAYLRRYPVVTFRSVYDADPVCYVPVAGFDASMDPGDRWYFDILRADYGTEEEAEAFLSELRARSYWTVPFDVTPEDRMIVLVTCSYLQTNGRFLLFCRELREGETAEDVVFAMNGPM